jgi:hypothetical protein
MVDQWQCDRFQEQIGNSYEVEIGQATTLTLTLREARPLSADSRSPDSSRNPFSLIFKGPVEPIVPQGIYRFRRDTSDSMEIFIVPIGPDEDGMKYEAIFS